MRPQEMLELGLPAAEPSCSARKSAISRRSSVAFCAAMPRRWIQHYRIFIVISIVLLERNCTCRTTNPALGMKTRRKRTAVSNKILLYPNALDCNVQVAGLFLPLGAGTCR